MILWCASPVSFGCRDPVVPEGSLPPVLLAPVGPLRLVSPLSPLVWGPVRVCPWVVVSVVPWVLLCPPWVPPFSGC